MPRASRTDRIAALAVTALIGFVVVVPAAANGTLWPDALEYLAIANSWVHGAGFVNPVKWTFYLDTGTPFPAFAQRAPLPVVLFAAPLALGASVVEVKAFHAVLAAAVVGALVLFARRVMSLPAATACGLLIGLAEGWLMVSPMPMSDVPAIGALLLVLASAPRATRDVPGALLCAAATLAGWATRPTILFVVAPIVLVALWSRGVRGLLANVPFRVYLLATFAGYAVVYQATLWLTGVAPYAGYGFMAEIVSAFTPLRYGKEYVGAASFVRDNAAAVLRNVGLHAEHLYEALFVVPRWNLVGWIGLPGAIYALVAPFEPGPRAERLRLLAITALMYGAQAALTYGAFDAYRYPMPAVVCAAVCGFALLDDALRAAVRALARLVRRADPAAPQAGGATSRVAWLLVVGVLAQYLLYGGRQQLALAGRAWGAYLAAASSHAASPPPAPPPRRGIRALCPALRRGALVAAPDPWTVHGWCGNPAITLPIDLDGRPRLQVEFLEKERPAYLVRDGSHQFAWLARSRRLRRVAASGALQVFEYEPAASRRPAWRSPPPPLCAGQPDACPRADLD